MTNVSMMVPRMLGTVAAATRDRHDRGRDRARRFGVFLAVPLAIAGGFAKEASAQMRLAASLDRAVYTSGQEMRVTLTFQNQTDALVPVVVPSTLDAGCLHVVVSKYPGGEVVPRQARHRIDGAGGEPVSLKPQQALNAEFDLDVFYPLGLEPGEYSLSATYHLDARDYPERAVGLRDEESTAASLRFRVLVRTAAEEAEFQRFRRVLSAPSNEITIAEAETALALYPQGLFARRMKVELAAALWREVRLAEAAERYAQVSADPASSQATRDLATFNRAQVLHAEGRIEEALSTLETMESSSARIAKAVWRRELEEGKAKR